MRPVTQFAFAVAVVISTTGCALDVAGVDAAGGAEHGSVRESADAPNTAVKGTWLLGEDGNHTEFDSEAEETVAKVSARVIQPVSAALMGVLILATVLERLEIGWIPESAVIIAVGAGCGWALDHWDLLPHSTLLELNAPVVNLAFLPIIIFESGWSLRQKDFVAQFAHILLFAVVGTFIAMGIVGGLIYATGDYHGILDARTAFTYASLIAATDPVATLSTYSSLNVDPLLHILVFGESTINDAVAIVVFDVMNSDEVWGPVWATHMPPLEQVWTAVLGGIVEKLTGSILIGVGLGVAYTLTLKWSEMRHAPSFEILFMLISCYLTFSTAESAGMSGIIAVLFCGIFMGIYAKPHLSGQGSVLASFMLKEVATMADMGVFLLVGIDTVLLNIRSVKFSLWVMLFCIVARAVAVGICGVTSNSVKRFLHGREGSPALVLSWRHLVMMWHAGLRGGIALVLCLEMGDWVDMRNKPGTKQELINTTIIVIIVFLIVFGGSTACSLSKLGIPVGMEVEEGYLYDRALQTSVHRCFHSLHHRWLVPVLYPREEGTISDGKGERVEPLREIMSDLIARNRGHYWFGGQRADAEECSTEDDSE